MRANVSRVSSFYMQRRMLATIIENRDNVAQLINHRNQNLEFGSLVVGL